MAATQAGFLNFIRGNMGIPVPYLPDDADVIGMAFQVANSIVNPALQNVAANPTLSPPLTIFDLAVYNLAGDQLLNYAQDQPGQNYFAGLREKYKLTSFISGVTTASYDQGTGQTTLNPEFMKELMLSDLQNMKTPYGRQYLAFAQRYGTLWGMS